MDEKTDQSTEQQPPAEKPVEESEGVTLQASVEDILREPDPIAPYKEKRNWWGTVLWIVGLVVVFAVVVVALPFVLGYLVHDRVSVNDADLQLQKVSVANTDNAYDDLANISKTIYTTSDPELASVYGSTSPDENVVAQLIATNTNAFSLFTDAAGKPIFQDPATADPTYIVFNTPLPSDLNSWRDMAELSALRAKRLAQTGAGAKGMQEAMNAVEVGQKIENSQAQLIVYLVGMAMKDIGLKTIQSVASSSTLPASTLVSYANELGAYYNNGKGLITADKVEYYRRSAAVDSLARGNQNVVGTSNNFLRFLTTNNFYFQPNGTKVLFANIAHDNIQAVSESCDQVKVTTIEPLRPTDLIQFYLGENVVGKILHDMLGASLTVAAVKKCQENVLVGATQTLIALKAYKEDTGTYPASLSDLAPKYLAKVPTDPYGGKPFKYSKEKKIIYSIGQDMKDEGGSTGSNWKAMPDPTFPITF